MFIEKVKEASEEQTILTFKVYFRISLLIHCAYLILTEYCLLFRKEQEFQLYHLFANYFLVESLYLFNLD